MNVLIAVENDAGLDSKLDSRFGRASYFLIYDMDEEKIVSIEENKFKNEPSGVGLRTASFLIDSGCKVAIGARPGPKAASILNAANIKIVTVENKTAKEAIDWYKQNAAL